MNQQLIKTAQAYSKQGFSVIPTTQQKIPILPTWRSYQSRPMTQEECVEHFKKAQGMGLLGGGKMKLTCIDIDLKNDLSGDFYQRLCAKVPTELFEKFYIQKTQNNGYHWVFSCDTVEPSQKITRRLTTAEERHQVYMENFENPLTREKAFKIVQNFNDVCIVESRGEGAYFLVPPTRGYERVQGKIQKLSEEEYQDLFHILRSMDEVNKVRKNDTRFSQNKTDWKVSPFQDYNSKADSLFLLESNGWSVVGKRYGKNIRLKRPGNSSAHSGIYDSDTRIFSCFSTSASLDVNRGYTASDLFTEFSCNGDIGLAYSKLVNEGYGLKASL